MKRERSKKSGDSRAEQLQQARFQHAIRFAEGRLGNVALGSKQAEGVRGEIIKALLQNEEYEKAYEILKKKGFSPRSMQWRDVAIGLASIGKHKPAEEILSKLISTAGATGYAIYASILIDEGEDKKRVERFLAKARERFPPLGSGKGGEKLPNDYRFNWQGVAARLEYLWAQYRLGLIDEEKFEEEKGKLPDRVLRAELERRIFEKTVSGLTDKEEIKREVEKYREKIFKAKIKIDRKIKFVVRLGKFVKQEFPEISFEDLGEKYFLRRLKRMYSSFWDIVSKTKLDLLRLLVDRGFSKRQILQELEDVLRRELREVFLIRHHGDAALELLKFLEADELIEYLKKEINNYFQNMQRGREFLAERLERRRLYRPREFNYYDFSENNDGLDPDLKNMPNPKEAQLQATDLESAFLSGVLYPDQDIQGPLKNAKIIGQANNAQEVTEKINQLEINTLVEIKNAVKAMERGYVGSFEDLLQLLQRVEGRNDREKEAKKIRILKLLMERDSQRATTIVFDILKNKQIDLRYRKYLLLLLIRINENKDRWPHGFTYKLYEKIQLPGFFEKIMSFIERPDMNYALFRSVIDVFYHGNPWQETKRLIDINDEEHIRKAHQFLDAFNTIDYYLFLVYTQTKGDNIGRFLEQIRSLMSLMYKNVSVTDIKGVNRDMVAGVICAMYRPTNLSANDVRGLLGRIGSKTTEHLKRWKGIPPNGEEVFLSKKLGKRKLKKGESLNEATVSAVIQLVDVQALSEDEEYILEDQEGEDVKKKVNPKKQERIARAIRDLVRCNLNMGLESIQTLLEVSRAADKEIFRTMEKRFDADPYTALTAIRELVEEDFPETLKVWLINDSGASNSIEALIGAGAFSPDNKHIQAIRQQIKKNFPELAEKKLETKEEVVDFVIEVFRLKILSRYSQALKKEIEKFEREEVGSGAGEFKAYISKNEAAFFAKSTGGICIANDTKFYNENKNHFPLVITRLPSDKKIDAGLDRGVSIPNKGEVAIGGALFTVENIKDQKTGEVKESLVVYAINPSQGILLEGLSVQSFCEEVLRIAKKFCRANGLERLYVTGTNHGSISNRQQVQDYMKKYRKDEKKIRHQFQESSSFFSYDLWQVDF